MQTTYQKMVKISLIFFIILGFNYGVSFQQFLHYDWTDSRGLSDSSSYLDMSNGEYNVPSGHRYRIIIPFFASFVRNLIQSLVPPEQLYWLGGVDTLSFYIVNCLITSLTGLFLYFFLTQLKFDSKLSLLGVFIFLGSRITIITTGAPIVDSLYHLAIIIIIYFCLTQQTIALALTIPLLILTKETIIPFLFLPLFLKTINRKLIGASLLVSFPILFWIREKITASLPNVVEVNDPIFDVVIGHLGAIPENMIKFFFSVEGWHSFFSTFSIFWLIAAFGVWLEFKKASTFYQIPPFVFLIIPITALFSILSSNTGRMLLSLFPIVIPYTLIGIDYLCSQKNVQKRALK
jgi:hypothetical protein